MEDGGIKSVRTKRSGEAGGMSERVLGRALSVSTDEETLEENFSVTS
jgi:hypothetical protein